MVLWQKVDCGLRRRLADLDEALQGQQKILQKNPESFAFKLSCDSLLEIKTRLQQELVELVRHRSHERVTFALQGHQFNDNSASIGYLGTFILRLQKLYSSLAQAITTGPTRRGPIAAAIDRQRIFHWQLCFRLRLGWRCMFHRNSTSWGIVLRPRRLKQCSSF